MNTQGCDKPCHKINPAALQWTVSFLLLKRLILILKELTSLENHARVWNVPSWWLLVTVHTEQGWQWAAFWEVHLLLEESGNGQQSSPMRKTSWGLLTPCFGNKVGWWTLKFRLIKVRGVFVKTKWLCPTPIYMTLFLLSSAVFISENTLASMWWTMQAPEHIWVS